MQTDDTITYLFWTKAPMDDRADTPDSCTLRIDTDTDGHFLDLRIQGNLFQDNSFTVTETVTEVQEDSISEAIAAAFQASVS